MVCRKDINRGGRFASSPLRILDDGIYIIVIRVKWKIETRN